MKAHQGVNQKARWHFNPCPIIAANQRALCLYYKYGEKSFFFEILAVNKNSPPIGLVKIVPGVNQMVRVSFSRYWQKMLWEFSNNHILCSQNLPSQTGSTNWYNNFHWATTVIAVITAPSTFLKRRAWWRFWNRICPGITFTNCTTIKSSHYCN